jgi:hypothetical protein
MSVAAERYRLMRTHRWDDEVLQRVIEGSKRRPRSPCAQLLEGTPLAGGAGCVPVNGVIGVPAVG